MMYTRMIGDAQVSNVIEYSGPTHDPGFLFPGIAPDLIAPYESWLGPNHWSARLQKFIITIQLWVVQAGANVILIDGGVGNRKPRKAQRMNLLNTLVPSWLAAAGAAPDEVTHVVHTHMHVDHVGWNTRLDGEHWVPSFPKARHLFPRRDYVDLKEGIVAGRIGGDLAVAFADSVQPIFDAGLAELIDETETEVAGCLAVEPVPGHTAGMLSYRLRSRGEEGIFSGDVMHSPMQIVVPALNTAFCEHPALARATRPEFLARAADRDALVMPCHFGAPYCGRIRRQGDGFVFEPESR